MVDYGQNNVRKQIPRGEEWIKKYFPRSNILKSEGWQRLKRWALVYAEELDNIDIEDEEFDPDSAIKLVEILAVIDGYMFGFLCGEEGYKEVKRILDETESERMA